MANLFKNRLIWLFLSIVPLTYLIFLLTFYQTDIPVWDQWNVVPMLDKLYQGNLSVSDIWKQCNEHRRPFPWMIILGLAYLTHWNMSYELACNVLLGAVAFVTIAHQIKRTAEYAQLEIRYWIFPVISVLVFSISQWENWFWGWQVNNFLQMAAVVGGIVLLANRVFTWGRLVGASVLGVVATCSAPTAFTYWPIALGVLCSVHYSMIRKNWSPVVAWVAIAALTLFLYFHGYDFRRAAQFGGQHSVFEFLQAPVVYGHFVLNYLGSPVVYKNDIAWVAGAVGVLSFFYLPWWLVKSRLMTFGHLAPYFALGLFSIGAAILSGMGRSSFGPAGALASRYTTMSVWLWVANATFFYLVVIGLQQKYPGNSHSLGKRVGLLAFSIITVMAIGCTFAAKTGAIWYQYRYILPARNYVVATPNQDSWENELVSHLHPEGLDSIRRGTTMLRKYELAAFRNK